MISKASYGLIPFMLLLLAGCEGQASFSSHSTTASPEKPPTSMVVREKHLVSYGDGIANYKYWLISEDDRWADVTWAEFCHARVGQEIKVGWKEP